MTAAKNRYFAYRSFWPEIETMKRFRECGVDTFMFMISNITNSLGMPYTGYSPVWKWNSIYDLSAFDRQIGDILEAIPDARLMCMVDLNTPQWWTRYLGAFGVKYDSYYELGKISPSQAWHSDTSEYMQTLLQHAEKNYSDHLVAYILGCGGATEWHDRSRGEESIYRLTAFRQWQLDHGRTPTDIPSRMLRDAGSYDFDNSYFEPLSYYNGIDPTGCYKKLFPNGFGLMRTPEKNQEALDYWRFCNEFNALTVKYFLTAARWIIRPEAELGIFFGYGSGSWTMVSSGHLDYESLFDAPELDFVIAPIGYSGRGAGGGSSSLTTRESISLRGKRMLQEMDHRTYTSNRKLTDYCELPDPLENSAERVKWRDATDSRELARKFSMATNGIWKNDEEILAGVKRDAAAALINGESLWWFDMWGGSYQGERVMSAFKQVKGIWDEQSKEPALDIAEVMMVVDPKNMLYLNDMDARCNLFRQKPLECLSLAGMPYTVASFNDLEALDMERFKMVILCHPFELTLRHRQILAESVLNNGRSVIWLYGPGIIKDGQWQPDNVREVCGVPFGTAGINAVDMAGWLSVYVHDPRVLTPESLREIAIGAGCHIYCPQPRPVYANNRLLAVHTGVSEELTINFPRECAAVRELFSGRNYMATASVQIRTHGPDTLLFSYK